MCPGDRRAPRPASLSLFGSGGTKLKKAFVVFSEARHFLEGSLQGTSTLAPLNLRKKEKKNKNEKKKNRTNYQKQNQRHKSQTNKANRK
ncbi:hypothetical protein E2C01_055426 [Portunus trituberculatus]|uniref:Uncharacterized protein n=1 Tax=Portunus trituberculatus TaxID=210409 RepID=A0A5B7GUR5_PORTR|nr:hypothetical protein [Portunus trituberculatus]